ncbi:2,4-dienoyl-CoA reductase [Vibrio astriarenae]|nr:2,4-dienoyl-CoA reductase [Vibrio sp. C7]
MKNEHSILFEAMKIGPMELKNRYSMAPMGTLGLVDGDGAYNKRGIDTT